VSGSASNTGKSPHSSPWRDVQPRKEFAIEYLKVTLSSAQPYLADSITNLGLKTLRRELWIRYCGAQARHIGLFFARPSDEFAEFWRSRMPSRLAMADIPPPTSEHAPSRVLALVGLGTNLYGQI
jgi:hypothetical protein